MRLSDILACFTVLLMTIAVCGVLICGALASSIPGPQDPFGELACAFAGIGVWSLVLLWLCAG